MAAVMAILSWIPAVQSGGDSLEGPL